MQPFGSGPFSEPSPPVGPSVVGRQATGRVRPAGCAPAPARAHLHEPMKIVTAMRATVRPAAVQRPEHPPLLTSEQSHLSSPTSLLIPTPPIPTCICVIDRSSGAQYRRPIWPTDISCVRPKVEANSTAPTEMEPPVPFIGTFGPAPSGLGILLDHRPITRPFSSFVASHPSVPTIY
jgi:hypothetical protein